MAVGIGLIGFFAAVVLGVLGHFSETELTFFGKRYHIDHYGRPKLVDDSTPPSPAPH